MEMSKSELLACIEELESVLCYLESKNGKTFKEGRKSEVLAILQQGRITVKDLAKKVGISERNISSQMSYLRKDGVKIGTDSLGRKFIEQD